MPVRLEMRFVVAPDAPPFAEDYLVFVHVIDDHGRMIGAVDDSPPTPTKAGSFEMRERPDPYAVIFREGWHSLESPKGSGSEWRWSSKSGSLSFANPKRDADLVLELDQPSNVFSVARHVEIRLGEGVVDDFDLAPDPPAVVSDKTFVPANVADLRSSDTPQLGVRVFRAFVQPKQ
jgi:hypothetical protein